MRMKFLWILWIGVGGFFTQIHAAPISMVAPLPAASFSSTQTISDSLRKKITPELNLYSTVVSGLSPLYGVSAKYKFDRYHSVGVQLMTGSLSFRHWMPSPTLADSYTQYSSAQGQDPGSQFNRARGAQDSWSILAVGPRIEMEGRLFKERLGLWSESGGFGVSYAKFNDKVNDTAFSGLLFSFSAFAHYHLGASSPWSIQFGFENHFGSVSTNGSNFGRLPVNILLGALGVAYSL